MRSLTPGFDYIGRAPSKCGWIPCVDTDAIHFDPSIWRRQAHVVQYWCSLELEQLEAPR